MMRTYYRKTYEVVGWAFHADVYCVECGENLPEVDPEGNERYPVFLEQLDELVGCACWGCGSDCEEW